MGFLSNLFGRKKSGIPSVGGESQILTQTGASMEVYQKAVELVAVGNSFKTELISKLEQAFVDPGSFYDEYKEFTLSERGLSYPKDSKVTPKFVFIDTLIENGQMAEVDWKEAEEEIRFSIAEIIKAKEYPIIFAVEDQFEEEDTYTVINKINQKELLPEGYSLQILDIQSDCYVFTVVPLNRQKEVKGLFDQISSLTGI